MATGKRFYWLKLKESFLMGDEIDFLMSQKNGSDYAMMYIMLCMKTINTDGKLLRRVGELLMPVDVDKLQRDLKYFSRETIIYAIELYKQFGLIYEETDGVLTISNYDELVGYETDYAEQKRKQRTLLKVGMDNVRDIPIDNVHSLPLENKDVRDNVHANVHTEIEIEKDIDIDKDIDRETTGKTKRKRFVKPTLEELEAYKKEKNLNVDCQHFLDFYDSKGWMIGKNSMKDWKATMRGWSSRERNQPKQPSTNRFHNFEQRTDDLDALLKEGRRLL